MSNTHTQDRYPLTIEQLFANGCARWGQDSLLETAEHIRGDLARGTLLPGIETPVIGHNNITFTLGPFPHGYDGISVLVNDIERFRGYQDWDSDLWQDGQRDWTWFRHNDPGATQHELLPEYFRFAYMEGNRVADYTKAGKWTVNGDWIEMADGPSKF